MHVVAQVTDVMERERLLIPRGERSGNWNRRQSSILTKFFQIDGKLNFATQLPQLGVSTGCRKQLKTPSNRGGNPFACGLLSF